MGITTSGREFGAPAHGLRSPLVVARSYGGFAYLAFPRWDLRYNARPVRRDMRQVSFGRNSPGATRNPKASFGWARYGNYE